MLEKHKAMTSEHALLANAAYAASMRKLCAQPHKVLVVESRRPIPSWGGREIYAAINNFAK